LQVFARWFVAHEETTSETQSKVETKSGRLMRSEAEEDGRAR
jgi:hypothetical protein